MLVNTGYGLGQSASVGRDGRTNAIGTWTCLIAFFTSTAAGATPALPRCPDRTAMKGLLRHYGILGPGDHSHRLGPGRVGLDVSPNVGFKSNSGLSSKPAG